MTDMFPESPKNIPDDQSGPESETEKSQHELPILPANPRDSHIGSSDGTADPEEHTPTVNPWSDIQDTLDYDKNIILGEPKEKVDPILLNLHRMMGREGITNEEFMKLLDEAEKRMKELGPAKKTDETSPELNTGPEMQLAGPEQLAELPPLDTRDIPDEEYIASVLEEGLSEQVDELRNTYDDVTSIRIPQTDTIDSPGESLLQRISDLEPRRLEEDALEKVQQEQGHLTKEFMEPSGKIVFARLKTVLEGLLPSELDTKKINTGAGEMIVFKYGRTNIHDWQRVTFGEALSNFKGSEKFELAFVISPDQAQIPEHVDTQDYGLGGPASNLDLHHIVLRVSEKDVVEDSNGMPSVGYAKKQSAAQLTEAFQGSDHKFPFYTAGNHFIDTEEFVGREGMRNGLLRDAIIALDQDIPLWYREQVGIKKDFVIDAKELFMKIQESRDGLFNFEGDRLYSQVEAIFSDLQNLDTNINNPFNIKVEQPHLRIELENINAFNDFLQERQQEWLSLLNPEYRSVIFNNGWIADLRVFESTATQSDRREVLDSETIDSSRTGKLYFLGGLLLTHPQFPQVEIQVNFENFEPLTSDELKIKCKKETYIAEQKIASVFVEGTRSPLRLPRNW